MTQDRQALFSFVKLNVRDIQASTTFFEKAFGLHHANTVDTPMFREHMMTGPKGAMTVVLFHWKDGREIETGNGYGPVGMITRDLNTDLKRALDAGATQRGETITFGPARIAFVHTPDGHEIELMQMAEAAAA